MSKEEKKRDLKPIAKKDRELKSWVGLQRTFCFPCLLAGLQLLCSYFLCASYRMSHHTANNLGLPVVILNVTFYKTYTLCYPTDSMSHQGLLSAGYHFTQKYLLNIL